MRDGHLGMVIIGIPVTEAEIAKFKDDWAKFVSVCENEPLMVVIDPGEISKEVGPSETKA